MGARRARNLVWVAVPAVLGCAAKVGDPRAHAGPVVPASDAGVLVMPPPPILFTTVEALAGRQLRLAPGMHEIARGESTSAVALPKVARDTCVRVAYAAAEPLSVKLVSQTGSVLAESRAETEGALDDRGPVCFQANREPKLTFGSSTQPVRYVVWAAP